MDHTIAVKPETLFQPPSAKSLFEAAIWVIQCEQNGYTANPNSNCWPAEWWASKFGEICYAAIDHWNLSLKAKTAYGRKLIILKIM